ncbi:MAG: KR domain-containing protein [Deltaproteobacteria bacterium]|nr:KR domain-containing protein [Deltaproteobacteria bacterium]
MPERVVLITGSSGNVGMYLSLFLARLGIADIIYLGSRNIQTASTVLYNARCVALMGGFNVRVEHARCDLADPEATADMLLRIKPTLIIHSAALLSLYPFFSALRRRQNRMNFVAGFAHTLPKDLALLWPLMVAVKDACPDTPVVNLAAPDTAHAILSKRNLSPTVGAGTIDSTAHGIRLAVANRINVDPLRVDVRLICHHAIRRFSPDDVPFFLRIHLDRTDVTEKFDQKELISEAVDVSGVETMTTPVSTNAPTTAASAAETARAILLESEMIRHGAGAQGIPGATPVRLSMRGAQIILPDGIHMKEALRMNEAGMRMTGVERIEEDGTVVFTERERYWLREGMGLSWARMPLEDARPMSGELERAYKRLKKEETV